MDLKDKSLIELKSIAYDLIKNLEILQNNLKFVNSKIQEKENESNSGKVE